MIFKNRGKISPQVKEATRKSNQLDEKGMNQNPYLNARRTWNEHVGSVVSSRQTWQVIGIFSLIIALASIGGIIYIGSQSKFVPYVIEVDQLGNDANIGPAKRVYGVDPRIMRAAVSSFIEDARMVTPDIALLRRGIFSVYAHLSPGDPATKKMNAWFDGSTHASPFERASKETVDIHITSTLPQTAMTWQVDWIETTRDRQGEPIGLPVAMRALLTVYVSKPSPQTTEEQMRNNPLGIYVRDFSWSRLQ